MNASQLIETFDQIIQLSQQLCQNLSPQQNQHWLPLTAQEEDQGLNPLQKAKNIYQDYWYQDGQDGRETRSCFGLIAVTDQQIQLALNINEYKESLKKQVKHIQSHDKSQWLELKGTLGKRHNKLRDSLHFSGLTRLHLKQTWRHIPVIERSPTRVGFNWYNSGRSIQKISVEQAFEALSKLDTSSPHIQTQLSQVSKLASNTPLAKVQNLAPTMRANLFYEDNQFPERQAMNISLPILFKARSDGKLPSHNQPELEAPITRKRAIRSDRTIEDEPFLPSIRVHRYS